MMERNYRGDSVEEIQCFSVWYLRQTWPRAEKLQNVTVGCIHDQTIHTNRFYGIVYFSPYSSKYIYL